MRAPYCSLFRSTSALTPSHMQHGDTAQAIRRVQQAARAPGQRETSNLAGWQSLRRVPRAMAVAAAASQGGMDTIELEVKVEGMVCEGCSSRVERALRVVPGVHSAAVSLETGIATVLVLATDQFQAATERLPRVVESVQQLGFEAEPYFGDD